MSKPIGIQGIGDGCTTSGAEYVLIDVAAFRGLFTPACDNHDICYTSLGATYAMCDSAMLDTMRAACRSKFSPWFPVELALCLDTAQKYYTAIKAWGSARDPLPQMQLEASIRSWTVFGSIDNPNIASKCSTSVSEQTNLYTQSLQNAVYGAFATYAGRAPSVFEFMEAVNQNNPYAQVPQSYNNYAAWLNGVNNYASNRRWLPVIPNVNYTSNAGTFTLTAPSGFANYTWRLNGQMVSGNSITIAIPESKYDSTFQINGFAYGADRSYPNVNRNIVSVRRTISVKGWCSPRPAIQCL